MVVESPGTRATIQDLGRPGYRAFGVPVSGAFDRDAHALANALLGNGPDAATLEMTLVGGAYRAEAPLAIALAGAPMVAKVVGADGSTRLLTVPQTVGLRPGDRLVLGGSPRGARTYLAVRGGWQLPIILGSRSSEAPIRPGDRLPARSGVTPTLRPGFATRADDPSAPIRVVAGPVGVRGWLGATYRVGGQSDRMGLRLEGPTVMLPDDPDRDSLPVTPGTIQVAGGRPIVLGPACGTMGGYPVIAHVITADLDRLGQHRPGDPIRFRSIDLREARRLDRDDRRGRAEWTLRTATFARGGAGAGGD